MAKFFNNVPQGECLEIFSIGPNCKKDPSPHKADLCVAGSFITEEGDLWVFPVVQKVEKEIAAGGIDCKGYLPALGLEEFTTGAVKLALGAESKAFCEKRFVGVQTLSGTGALRVTAEFLAKVLNLNTFYVSAPTWENHHRIFLAGGFKHKREYRYWNAETRSLDFNGMIQDLQEAPENSVVILQTVAHNPTGVDPTPVQWKEIGRVCKDRNLFPVFDCVRQGFVTDLQTDAWNMRCFADELGLEIAICQSFAKNLALYNERVGNATIVTQDTSSVYKIKSQMTLIVRGNYSNPPAHGARIAAKILNDPDNFEQLADNLKIVRCRVTEMRTKLYDKLVELGTPGDWSHVKSQLGIFVYSGMTPPQVDYLRTKYHLYMFRSCHINVCTLNSKNLDYVATAIHDAVTMA